MTTAQLLDQPLSATQSARTLPQGSRRKWSTSDRQLERELVERAQSGDHDAFSQLYEQMADRIYRYIFFRVNDDYLAEDLTAEVFLRVWEHLPSYRPQNATVLAWVYTIAHNCVIDHYRTARPTQPLDEAQAIAAPGPSPHEQSELQFETRSMRQAMQCLTTDQRDVLLMRFIDGMETSEIATRMGKSEGAVRALQMRGLQMLSRLLRDK